MREGTTAPNRGNARIPMRLLEGSNPALRKRRRNDLALPLPGLGVRVSKPTHIPRGDFAAARLRMLGIGPTKVLHRGVPKEVGPGSTARDGSLVEAVPEASRTKLVGGR